MKSKTRKPHFPIADRVRLSLLCGLLAVSTLGLSLLANAQLSSPAPDSELELRGYTRIGNSHAFSLRNTRTGESEWVWDDQPGEYFTIVGFDPEQRVATVRHHNQISSVTLQRTRIDHQGASVTAALPSFEPPEPPPGRTLGGQQTERRTIERTPINDSASRPFRGENAPDESFRSGQNFPGGFPGGSSGGGIPPSSPSNPPLGGDHPPDTEGDSRRDDPFGPPPPPPTSPPPSYTPST